MGTSTIYLYVLAFVDTCEQHMFVYVSSRFHEHE